MRYSRHKVLKEIGKKGQNILSKKIVTIVGLGALGTNTSSLLARSGINLKLIDFDKIDITNLQRQSLYEESDINKQKVTTSLNKLKKINSEIKIEIFNERLNDANLNLLKSDLVIDCTDNLTTRFLINDYCYNKIPWIHTAAIKHTGVIFNILPKKPCLKCIYKKNLDLERCEEFGVLNTIVSLISSIAATQAIKILLKKDPEESLLRFNIWDNEIEKIKIKKSCEKCLKSS
ncbi:HesA/MoeB/ThiF family protein [Candidatus Woesearchaeota archaeon]|nr:HesA/MoeB/ThiF family protein [Candidatus Woesearchaeota archaeon]